MGAFKDYARDDTTGGATRGATRGAPVHATAAATPYSCSRGYRRLPVKVSLPQPLPCPRPPLVAGCGPVPSPLVHASVTVQFQASKVTIILQDCFAWGSALGAPLCTRRLVLMAELPGAAGLGNHLNRPVARESPDKDASRARAGVGRSV